MKLPPNRRRQDGWLMVDLLAALAILLAALLPIAYSLASEKRLARSLYHRAIATEIVDGEMEILAAGEWRALGSGQHDYAVHGGAVSNLPPGRFILSVGEHRLKLEWRPAPRHFGGPVVREVMLP